MKFFLMLVAPLALIGAAVTAAQRPAPVVIEGAVMRAGANDPVRNAIVKLSAPGGGAERQTTTDAEGRFYFPGGAAGKYRISAVKDGFDGFSETITLAAGNAVPPVRIEMTPLGVISGRVTDERGKPAVRATVAANMVSYDGCQRILTAAGATTTNDLGEYHLAWLRPGRYYISAVETEFDDNNRASPLFPEPGLRGALAARIPPDGAALYEEKLSARVVLNKPFDSGRNLRRVPTYAPNTADWRNATPVDVQIGMDVSSVNVAQVPALPLRHVRGTTTDTAGQGAAAAIRLVNVALGVAVTARTDTAGSFDIPVFAPGRYVLYASAATPGAPARGAGGVRGRGGRGARGAGPEIPPQIPDAVARDARPDAAVDVDFKDRDIDGLLVPLGSEKLYLSGHLQMETRAAVASSEIPELGAIGLTLRPDPCFAGASEHKVGPANATAAATRWQVVSGTDAGNLKASFSNLGVLPGRYRVFVEPLLVPGAGRNPSDPLQNAYVKSIRMGDVDVLSGGLELRSPPQAPLTIEIGAGPGMFKGRVLNERGLTVSAATVVLIPEAGWRFHAAHPLASTNDAGQFEFRGVPPGDYKAFAWEVMQNGAWQDPEFMRDYEARGTPIHIDEGKNSEREIVVISLAP